MSRCARSRPAAPILPSQTSTSTFLHSQLGVTAETVLADDDVTTIAYTRDPAGRLLSADGPAGAFWFFTDGLGSVVGIGDTDGALTASYRYDPFGVTVQADGPLAATNPWRYTGAYLDATGLYKLGERYYDPQHGRFTQQDPVVSPADPMHWNRYVYAGNNPINYTDSRGTCSRQVWNSMLGVVGAIGVVAVSILALPTIAFVSPWLAAGSVATAGLATGYALHSAISAGNAYYEDCVQSS